MARFYEPSRKIETFLLFKKNFNYFKFINFILFYFIFTVPNQAIFLTDLMPVVADDYGPVSPEVLGRRELKVLSLEAKLT
jgi:hypothetical protein